MIKSDHTIKCAILRATSLRVALDLLQSKFLDPLAVESATRCVLIQELFHLDSVPLFLLGKAKIGAHPLTYVSPHFVKSPTEAL